MSEALTLKALEEALSLGASYVEIRYYHGITTSLRVRKGIVESSSISTFNGMGIRVLKDGSWGFASLEDLTVEKTVEAARSAVKLASSSSASRSRRVEIAKADPVRDRVKTNVRKDPSQIPIEEKLKIIFDADNIIWSKSEKIIDDSVIYSDYSGKKFFVNSEGSEIETNEIRTYFAFQATAREMDKVSPAYKAIGGTIGFELVERNDPAKMAEEVATRAIRLLNANIPKGGFTTCVLDNDILGLLVHEAFGHTAEADLVLSGSILTGKLGEQVASEHVTIIDSPEPAGANGWIKYDDEGVRAKPVKIVEKGILKSFMHNRESATAFNTEPTGNARAQGYSYTPLIRMRNTYMEAGDWDPEEIIKETKEGFYLKGGLGGQADSNGEFMFSIQEAWRIENGELVEPFRGVTISGNAIEVLKSIDAVGKDLKIESPGNCGKFQWVPVDGGGPHVRSRMMIGGAL